MNLQENASLRDMNTFGIDCTCRYFATLTQEDMSDLPDIISAHPEHFILGGGSNVIFTQDYPGLVIKVDIRGISVKEDGADVFVTVGAGERWHDFVKFSLENKYYGLENLALIPGSAGAAPVQNIGAYGVEQHRFCTEVEAYLLHEKKSVRLSNRECKFGYRDSIFKNELKNKAIITKVTYKLSGNGDTDISYKELENFLKERGLENTPENIFHAVCEIRTNKLPDPSITGNAGSFFKNPSVPKNVLEKILSINEGVRFFPADRENMYKISAAWLIESCGLKGYSVNGAAVSEKHALILINKGNAAGRDVYELSEKIIDIVRERYGIRLEREVNIIR